MLCQFNQENIVMSNKHSTLLQSKLFTPSPRQKLVLRLGMLKQLDSYAGKKLILVTSPAGFGKTTLMANWLAHQNEVSTWISLDKNDNSLPLFISLVIAAVQKIEKEVGITAALFLKSTDSPSMPMVLTHLLNDLSSLEKPCRLVLDDYHEINNDEIHQAMDLIIEHTLGALQVVIISRHMPDLQISRLRAQNQIAEVRENDLRFNQTETERFFKDVMQLQLSGKELEIINRQSEGWVAGLQLAALGLNDQTNRAKYVRGVHKS
jgi:LuxR family transcriptional regulator, maltose regulon positive regulatory protein